METQDKDQLPKLTSKQVKFLRGLGHKLSPLVLIGKDGITQGIIDAVQHELAIHELIKVKIGNNSEVAKGDAAVIIPERSESTLVQLIGKTILLYKKNPKLEKDKRINIPKK